MEKAGKPIDSPTTALLGLRFCRPKESLASPLRDAICTHRRSRSSPMAHCARGLRDASERTSQQRTRCGLRADPRGQISHADSRAARPSLCCLVCLPVSLIASDCLSGLPCHCRRRPLCSRARLLASAGFSRCCSLLFSPALSTPLVAQWVSILRSSLPVTRRTSHSEDRPSPCTTRPNDTHNGGERGAERKQRDGNEGDHSAHCSRSSLRCFAAVCFCLCLQWHPDQRHQVRFVSRQEQAFLGQTAIKSMRGSECATALHASCGSRAH